MTSHRVGEYVREHGLQVRERFPGVVGSELGFEQAEVERFRTEWARGGDGRRRAAAEPDVRVAQARGKGQLGEDPAIDDAEEDIRKRAIARRADMNKRLGGRPRGTSHLPRERWAQKAAALEAGMPTLPTCEAIAVDDWGPHPANWPRESWWRDRQDPSQLASERRKAAAQRIYKAINSLQTTVP